MLTRYRFMVPGAMAVTLFIYVTTLGAASGCGNENPNAFETPSGPAAASATAETPGTVAAAEPNNAGSATTTATDDDGWGTFKGKIKVSGKIPANPAEDIKQDDKDWDLCAVDGKAPLDDNLVVGKKGQLRDVFVMMYRKSKDGEVPVHPSYEKLKAEPVVIDNKNCRFQPHAIFARTGQTIRLKNSDNVGHNVHVVTFANESNDNVPANDQLDIKFNDVDKSPGTVVCDVHKWMDGVIMIRDEPYVAITKADGSFEMKNVPAGKWKFQFWHKKCGYMKKLDVPGQKVGRRGEIEVEIADGKTLDLGELSISVKDLIRK